MGTFARAGIHESWTTEPTSLARRGPAGGMVVILGTVGGEGGGGGGRRGRPAGCANELFMRDLRRYYTKGLNCASSKL